MKKGKGEVPLHIKEYYDRGKKIERLLENTKAVHSQAYLTAAEALKEEGETEFDLERLEDVKYQDKFLDKMVDHYLSSAVKKLGLKAKPKDEWEQDVLLQQYMGVTRAELRRELRVMKGKYNLEHHEDKRDKLIKKQGEELVPLRYGHLEKKHIGDILDYVGVKRHLRHENIENPEQVAGLLDIYKSRGEQLTLADLAQTNLPQAFYTDNAKKELEELKKKKKAA